MSKEKRILKELVNIIEEEDIFDGITPNDISSKEWDSYLESLERDVGSLWEETI